VKYPAQQIYCVGERVPLHENNAWTVVLIVAPNSKGELEPIGTGFLVGVRSLFPSLAYTYVVTAAHVVRFAHDPSIRMTRLDGSVEDMPVPQWIYHDDGETDVAVCPIHLDQAPVPLQDHRHRF
jgi:hypothetical protein